MTDRTKFFVSVFLIFLAILFLFSPSLHYDFIGLDDNDLVVRNADIKSFSFERLWRLLTHHYITLYVPVTMLSYFLDYQIWFLTPFGFRFTNVVIHFFNSILVFLLFRHLTRKKNFLLAFLIALIFAIHPVQIESVVWIAERKNVLSTFFLFSALLCYWRAGKPGSERDEKRWLIYSLIAYVLGVLSKPSVVVFIPLVFVINDFYFDGSHGVKKRLWFYGLLLCLSVLVTLLTVWGTATSVEKYRYHGGSFSVNVNVMVTVFWRYIGLLLFPYQQNVLYSSRAYYSSFDIPVFMSTVGLLIFFLVIWLFLRRQKEVSFGLIWFFVTLLPVSNMIAPFPSIMNDRYLYVPIVGFFLALFSFLEWCAKGMLFRTDLRQGRVYTTVLGLALFFPFFLISIQRLPDWKNDNVLWESAFRRATRKDPRIYYFAGINQIERGNYKGAVNLLKESLGLDPTLDTRLALGTAFVAADKLDEAEVQLKKVIEMDPRQAGAYDQLGALYRKIYRYEEAEEAFKHALRLQPWAAVIHNNYALLLMDMDQPDKARESWEYALKLDPDCHFALRNISWFYFLRQQFDQAAPYLVRYLRRDPNDRQMRHMAQQIQSEFDRRASETSQAKAMSEQLSF